MDFKVELFTFGCAKSQNLARLHEIAKISTPKSFHSQNRKILYSQIIVTIRYAPKLKLGHFENKMKAPYVVYADTESTIEPTDSSNTDTNTVQTSEHVPCSFAYVIIRSDGRVHSEQLYRGEDAMDVFLNGWTRSLWRSERI